MTEQAGFLLHTHPCVIQGFIHSQFWLKDYHGPFRVFLRPVLQSETLSVQSLSFPIFIHRCYTCLESECFSYIFLLPHLHLTETFSLISVLYISSYYGAVFLKDPNLDLGINNLILV